VVAVLDAVRELAGRIRAQRADDPHVFQARLLTQLAEQARIEVFSRLRPPGRHLGPCVRIVAVIEDEKLPPAAALSRHIGDDAVAMLHPPARSFALYARLASR
jgi:hypothetical protein